MHADFERKTATTGPTRLLGATFNTANGLRHALRNESAVRQEVVLFIAAVPTAAFIAPNPGWYAAMLAVFLVLMTVELLNTAIEKLADHVMPDWNARIGIVKDVASAAVFMAILTVGLVWATAIGFRLGIF